MTPHVLVAGSEGALLDAVGVGGPLAWAHGRDVVLVPTAAAFVGASEASVRVASRLDDTGVRFEALMVTDRPSANEPYFAKRVREADVVVLLDGSALHARATLRTSAVGEALREATEIVAIGQVATLLGERMIDPRGGAPTTGLGLVTVVLTGPASAEQLARTRSLLSAEETLVVVDLNGAVICDGSVVSRVSAGGVLASRGGEALELGAISSR